MYETHVYICKKCMFVSEPNIGMKNQCPNCKNKLYFIRGKGNDVWARVKEIQCAVNINDRK